MSSKLQKTHARANDKITVRFPASTVNDSYEGPSLISEVRNEFVVGTVHEKHE